MKSKITLGLYIVGILAVLVPENFAADGTQRRRLGELHSAAG
jgi:hypothetical protein